MDKLLKYLVFITLSFYLIPHGSASAEVTLHQGIDGNSVLDTPEGAHHGGWYDDGAKFCYVIYSTDLPRITCESAAVAFDATTLTNTRESYPSDISSTSNYGGLDFNSDGTKAFLMDDEGDVNVYTLPTAWDPSTIVTQTADPLGNPYEEIAPENIINLNRATLDPLDLPLFRDNVTGFTFTPNGKKITIFCDDNCADDVSGGLPGFFQFDLSDPYDLDTIISWHFYEWTPSQEYLDIYDPDGVWPDTYEIRDFSFSPNGKGLYIFDRRGDTQTAADDDYEGVIIEIELGSAYDLSIMTERSFFALPNPSPLYDSWDEDDLTGSLQFINNQFHVIWYNDLVVYDYISNDIIYVDPDADEDVVGLIRTQTFLSKKIINDISDTISSRQMTIRNGWGSNDNNTKIDLSFNTKNAELNQAYGAISTALNLEHKAENLVEQMLPNNWSFWAEGSISLGDLEATDESSEVKELDGTSIAVGIDKNFGDNMYIGSAFKRSQNTGTIGENGSSLEFDADSFIFYGGVGMANDNNLDFHIGISDLDISTTRVNSLSETNSGTRAGNQFFGSISVNRSYDMNGLSFDPFARYDFGQTKLNEYTDGENNAITFGKQEIETSLLGVGFNLSNNIIYDKYSIINTGSFSYNSDMSNTSNADVSYIWDPDSNFTISIDPESESFIKASFGTQIISSNWAIKFNYQRSQDNNSILQEKYTLSSNFRTENETNYGMSFNNLNNGSTDFMISKELFGFDTTASIGLSDQRFDNYKVGLNKLIKF